MFVVVLRTVILFILVVTIMRFMGKRQIGQLQPYELAILIMVSALAAIPMEDIAIPLLNSMIPIILLFIFQAIVSLASQKSERVRAVICGRPTLLIKNGKLIESEMKEVRVNINDLLEQLRIAGYPNIADVEFAIFETNGKISVIPESQRRPLNAEDLGISTSYEGLPHPLIVDGHLNNDNLNKVNLNEAWLRQELKKFGFNDFKELLFVSLDTKGKLFFQKKGET